MNRLLTATLALLVFASAASAQQMLDDFSTSVMNDSQDVFYQDIDNAWGSKDKNGDGRDYTIVNGQLKQVHRDQGSVRAATVFTVDLSSASTGWAIEFDLVAGHLNDFDVWLGIDDGDNLPTDKVYTSNKNGNAPEDSAGEWVHVLNDGWFFAPKGPTGHIVASFHDDSTGIPYNPVDATPYNLLAFMIQTDALPVSLIVDNLELTNIPPPNCDFEPDGDCDIDDLDSLTLVGDLDAGVAVPPADAKFDIDLNSVVDQDDLATWLSAAAAANGFVGPYRSGDTNLDRDVDITDFNTFATNFDPGGSNAGNKFSMGDGDGDDDIDITDFNALASGFSPGGYDGAAAAVAADADPGQVDLVVDVETGEVTLDGNNAAISGLQVFSAGNSLLATDFTADVLQFVISTNTSTYAEGAFANMGVDGLISLGMMYDALVDARDVTFEYTMIGQPTVQGRVLYIPEPASLVLMGVGGLLALHRRRA